MQQPCKRRREVLRKLPLVDRVTDWRRLGTAIFLGELGRIGVSSFFRASPEK